MRWPQDADGWPLREMSRITPLPPHRWHVQQGGTGPDILLIHGAGGSTHGWRGVMPLLTPTARVTAIDLPGHGFTASPGARAGLRAMATDLAALIRHLDLRPSAVIAHSAGAAVALQMSLDGTLPPQTRIIGLNPALAPFDGLAGWVFPIMARALALTPFSATLFARTATPASIARLITATGSTLDADGHRLYLRLAQDSGHVAGTLAMMAAWNLRPLLARLGDIRAPVTFLIAGNDRTVPPHVGQTAARRIPGARVIDLPGLGHLAAEESPDRLVAAIRATLQT
jgi:magnesium chelatase accessory protein